MKKTALKLSIAATMFASVSAFSATVDSGYGTVASPAAGSVDVILLKGDAASISYLNTLDFGVVTGTTVLPVNQAQDLTVCLFSTLPDIAIDVDSFAGSAGQNSMAGPNGSLINYSLDLNGVALVDGDIGTPVSAVGNATDPTCIGGTATNGTLTASFTAAEFAGGTDAGAYSDTVTLTVSPL